VSRPGIKTSSATCHRALFSHGSRFGASRYGRSDETKLPNLLFAPEQFLAEAGFLRQWTLDAFQARLKVVAKVEGVEIGSVDQRGGCLRFKVVGPFDGAPNAKPKVWPSIQVLLSETGYRVLPQNLWSDITQHQCAIVVCAASEWRPRT
jgi:hypothetical protein